MRACTCLWMAALAACGGTPGGPIEDGGPDGSTSAGDVTGTVSDRYITADGVTERRRDLSALAVAAYVADGAGGMRSITGSGAADGTVVVPEVPDGPYVLRVGTRTRWLSSRTFEHTYDRAGRVDAVRPTRPTPVTLRVTRLLPWDPGDDLQLFSAGAGFTIFGAARPPVSATSASSSIEWLDQYSNLPDASRGDTVTALQLHVAAPTALGAVYTAQATDTLNQVSVVDGVGGALTVGLLPLEQGQHTTVRWLRSQLNGRPAEHGAGAVFDGDALYLDTLPSSTAHGFYASAPDLAALMPSGGEPTTDWTGPLAYGNPFPASWGQFVVANSWFAVPVTATHRETAVSQSLVDLATMEASGVGEVLSPVRNVELDGRELVAGMSGVGLSPVVTWDPPARGTATSYWVTVRGYTADDFWSRAYRIDTDEPRVQIPPGALEVGVHAFLSISAIHEGAPYPWGRADLVTASFDP